MRDDLDAVVGNDKSPCGRVMPNFVSRRLLGFAGCVLLGTALVAAVLQPDEPQSVPLLSGGCISRARALLPDTDEGEEIDEASCNPRMPARGMLLPTGSPTALDCDEARVIAAQALSSLAAPAQAIEPAKFADAASDWLDPHGLWSVAPDAPAAEAIRRDGAKLLLELQAPPGSGPCSTALSVGAVLADWSAALRKQMDEGFQDGLRVLSSARGIKSGSQDREHRAAVLWSAASTTPFQDGAVTKSALVLSRALGKSFAEAHASNGPGIQGYIESARNRLVPSLSAEQWSRVVIAAALRAFVPQLDAHGAWAPLDEEISLYDLSLEIEPPERLWSEMTRTVLGVRIDQGAMAPLSNGDIVLAVQDIAIGGMSVEQAEQMSIAADYVRPAPMTVTVLRKGLLEPLSLPIPPKTFEVEAAPAANEPHALAVDFVSYGNAQAAVIALPDVPDDLGARLSDAVVRVREVPDVRGIMLDVRSNGGGSTDGAIAALGIFLPNTLLFPMKRRDGTVDVERTPDIPAEQRWAGPLAVLVDGDSASAAEMIAGAISSYKRGIVVGDQTYGKGCAQEYLDDDARTGVLRLTTLLFCLPDGSPVQKVGIEPHIKFPLPGTHEKEAMVTRALGPWSGPDVRDPSKMREALWPAHGGRVGPCKDETICRALRAVGAAPAASR